MRADPSKARATAEQPPLASYLCLAASMALVGSYVGLSRLLLTVFPVFLLAWMRFLIGGLAMLPWLRREPGDAALTPTDRRLLFWDSLLGNVGFSLCMLSGVALTSAVAAGVVLAAIPAVVALLSRLALGERIAPRGAAAIALGVAGIAMLALVRGGTGAAGSPAQVDAGSRNLEWLGGALLVGAVFCESSYVVIGKRLAGRVSPRRVSALINLWGFALVTPVGMWQARGFDFAAVPPAAWALLVFYALAASVATVWLWMRGLREVPASQAGVFTVMLPISAAAVGVGVLGESFGAAHAVAMAMALAGLVLVTWPSSRCG